MAKPVKIVRAVVRYENSDDDNRDYDISLDVHVEEDGTVGNMENGIVRKGEQCVAIFSSWDDNKTTTTYDLTEDIEATIQSAINTFRTDVTEKSKKNKFKI